RGAAGKSAQAGARTGIPAAQDGSGSPQRGAAASPNLDARRKAKVSTAGKGWGETMSGVALDLVLARRIELAEAHAAVGAAEALMGARPDAGVAVAKIAGGFAVYCGANSP